MHSVVFFQRHANMFEQPTSKFYDLSVIDADDEFETELARLYAKHQESAKNKSEIEFHNFLQEKVSQNKKEYNEVVSALLYGVLTEPGNARVMFQTIGFVNRDNFSVVVNRLQMLIISIKFHLLKVAVREQIFWLVNELTLISVQNVDSLYLSLMRQLKGGDVSQRNVTFCDQLLKLCELHKPWLDMNPRVVATFVYTYLRTIPDHKLMQQLQHREIRFTANLLREKWMVCVPIGRDLARVLRDLKNIPEFSQIWEDLTKQPQKLSPRFKGLDMLLLQPTPKEFLRCRLTPDMEHKLLFIVQNLKISMYQRNLNWFIQRFLNTPEMEPHYVDVVRYLVAGWYPSNQILQSEIVPRYVVIGSMIRSVKSSTVAASIKLALIYDWLFFTPTDNIMFIEPTMLLMERSAERYPYITGVLMEFLKITVEEYFPPMKDHFLKCVSIGMKAMLSKGVIRSLMPLYKCPSLDTATREYMQFLFSEFLKDDPSLPPMPVPSMPKSVTLQPVNTPSEIKPTKIKQEEEKPTRKPSMDNDIDVDEFLYGESENKSNAKNSLEKGEIEDEDNTMPDAPSIPSAEPSSNDSVPKPSSIPDTGISKNEQPEETTTDIQRMEDAIESDDDELEIVREEEGLQSNQSYWIFGDSLKKFKEASIALVAAQKNRDKDNYSSHLLITKRSVRDILAVFLKMAIPAEVLELTIGSHIRNMIYLNRYPFIQSGEESNHTLSEEDIMSDLSKDVFDLIMATIWGWIEKETESEKLIKLLSCIAQNSKKKGRKHLVGMRWWSFIARQLEHHPQNMESQFPLAVSRYQAYIQNIHAKEKTQGNTEYLAEYLLNDLQSLAEQSVVDFNNLIPQLYRYFPDTLVGNLGILKLTLVMTLPDKLGQILCDLYTGSIRLFGEPIEPLFIKTSFELPSNEAVYFWQLLTAEIQGRVEAVEKLFSQTEVVYLLKTKFTSEIAPYLLTLVTSVKPTPTLLNNIILIVPEGAKADCPQVKTLVAILKIWSTRLDNIFETVLYEAVSGIIDQIENEETRPIGSEPLVHIFVTCWNTNLMPESFKTNKKLLASLAKLGGLTGVSCPKEWVQESRRKKRPIFLDSDEE
ncbi:protein-domain-containing protein [Sporodiniella umbellata]|nr:protein-domain-containing protein [Sporodiniella umbellata]